MRRLQRHEHSMVGPTLVCMVWLLCGATMSGQASFAFDAPSDWTAEAPASGMRVAQFSLPRAEDDPEDGSLVVYFFGGQGGSVDANLSRWIGQMTQPDGRPSHELAQSTTFRANDLPVTVLELTGTYVAEIRPGGSQRLNKPNFKLLAAVIETPGGSYFVKATGPRRTLEQWQTSIRGFLNSVRYE